jgi:hypothetical protein
MRAVKLPGFHWFSTLLLERGTVLFVYFEKYLGSMALPAI